MNTGSTFGTNVEHDVVSSQSRMNARSSAAEASRAPNQAGDSTMMYFERPVLIASDVWTPAPFAGFYDIFLLLMTTQSIREKLTHFTLIKFDLELEINLVGNPFTYGQLLAVWTPYPVFDSIGYVSPDLPSERDFMQYTQRQHVLLDVSVSSSTKMIVPFYWPYENFDLLSDDPGDYGYLRIMAMNNLRHVTGGDPQVSYMIRARMINCEVSVNTAQTLGSLPAMEVQAKFKKQGRTHGDEKTGATLSSWASRGAALAHASEPLTGPYGIATKAAMSAASGMLSAMGLGHPRSNEEPSRIGNDPYGNMANHNVGQDVLNLGIDCENEVSYSPEITGIAEDEMSFDYITKKETFIGKFTWDQTQGIGATIGYVPVEPMKAIRVGDRMYTTPIAHLGQLFSYWTGSLSFRFQFVASQFHRGRVRIIHEPRYYDNIDVSSSARWTTNQLAVVDVSDEKDFTIVVDWAQGRPWGKNRKLQQALLPLSEASYTQDDLIEANGVIALDVVNVMTIPDMTQDAPIEINVFVSAGPDFRYTALRHDFNSLHLVPPPTPPPVIPSGQTLSGNLVSGLIQYATALPNGASISGFARIPVWGSSDPTTPIQLTVVPSSTGTLVVDQGGTVLSSTPVTANVPTNIILSPSTTAGLNNVDLNFSQSVLATDAILPVKPGYKYVSNIQANVFKADFTNDLSTPGGDYSYQQNMGSTGAPQLRWTIGGPTGLYQWRNNSNPVYVTYKGAIRTTNGVYGPTEFSGSSLDWAVLEATPTGAWSSNTFQIMPGTGASGSVRSAVFLEVQALEIQADIVSNGESDIQDTDPPVLAEMQRNNISGTLAYKYFGEQYMHLRQLLGRWDFQQLTIFPSTLGTRFYSWFSLPAHPYRADALSASNTLRSDTIFGVHQWLISPYNGMRGSYRIRYHVECDSPVTVQSSLLPPESFFISSNINGDGNMSPDDILFKSFHGTRWQSAALNPSTTVEVPYFSRKKFLPCAARSGPPTSNNAIGTITGFRSNNSNVIITRFIQSGDDFTVVNWISTPILFIY